MLHPYGFGFFVGQDPRAETIAVLGLEVVGAIDVASTDAARELTTALRRSATEGPYVIAPNSDKELIDEKVMHNCPDERKECMAKIAHALNAGHLLYGKIERRSRRGSTGYQVSLRLFDVGSGQIASWGDFIPAAEASGAQIVEQGRRAYDQLIAAARPRGERRPRGPVADGVLIQVANEAFWRLTQYKPGRRLDMSDPQDRAMSKRWLEIYSEVKGHRDRATAVAQRTLNETVTPYILVVEQSDGSLRPQTFQQRSNLEVQYEWLLDQPQYYTYVAMFDFTQKRDAPIRDQFALSKRQQQMAASGWHGW